MSSKSEITLYGNVGKDPETRTLPAKTVTRRHYDPIIDEVVEREYATSEREVRSFSIAINKRDEDGTEVVRWIHCTDWEQHSRLVAKGDRVRVKGTFRERTYEKDGETKTVRELVVKDLKVERRKIREEAA